jgi:hypothetical protein
MTRRPRYKVWPVPQASDETPETHFAVTGPDVNYFARMDELAKIMQRSLNERRLTAAETRAVRRAIGLVLAGEFDGPPSELKALQSAWSKV